MSSRHGSDGVRRGIAPWIIITLVSALVLAAAVVAYVVIVGGDDDAASANCTSDVVLEVVASPGSAASVKSAAASFDATKPVARSACVTTSVTTVPGPDAEQALADGWTARSSPAPALWVPDSEADLLALEASNSALTAGRNQDPLAVSPVVLAVRNGDEQAVRAAALNWKDLPTAAGPGGTVGLPDDAKFILVLPDPTTNRATSYALQSVLAAGDDGTVDVAAVTAAVPELAAISAGGPRPQPALTQDALTALAAGAGGFASVPVVQSDLTAYSADTPGLAAVMPSGPTVGDAVFAVPLTASWVNPTLDAAAAEFVAYLRGDQGSAAFTAGGLELAGPSGPASTAASTDSGTLSATDPAAGSANRLLPDAGAEVAAALAAATRTAPSG